MYLKVSSEKWQPFCFGLNTLIKTLIIHQIHKHRFIISKFLNHGRHIKETTKCSETLSWHCLITMDRWYFDWIHVGESEIYTMNEYANNFLCHHLCLLKVIDTFFLHLGSWRWCCEPAHWSLSLWLLMGIVCTIICLWRKSVGNGIYYFYYHCR